MFILLLNISANCQTVDSLSALSIQHLENSITENQFQLKSPPDFDFGSDINYEYDDIDYLTLAGVGVLYLGTGIGVHIYQRNAWWKDQRRSFHFVDDWEYALWVDKVGHFYATTLLAHTFSSGLEAGNLSIEKSAIYGSIAAFLFEMYVEIEDGYGPDWGFSRGDAIADFLGAGYALSQYYIPELKNFQFKLSYYPSLKSRQGLHRGNAIDDYEGQKYWLSVRVNEYLPKKIEPFWPDFLNIAVGYGVSNLDGSGGGQKEFYISLDLDAEQIPLYGKGWQFVKNSLNYFHLPMPGIRITPQTAFLVFCY